MCQQLADLGNPAAAGSGPPRSSGPAANEKVAVVLFILTLVLVAVAVDVAVDVAFVVCFASTQPFFRLDCI